MDTLTPEQCRAARSLLGWTGHELAAAARVAIGSIRQFEKNGRRPMINNQIALRRALEEAGVVFLGDGEVADAGGPGVRLRKAP